MPFTSIVFPHNIYILEELEKLLNSESGTPSVTNGSTCISDSSGESKNQLSEVPNLNSILVTESSTDTLFDEADNFSYTTNIPPLPIVFDEWPPELPPKPLTFHLIGLFFTCYPNAQRVVHRPTLMLQLLEHSSSPRFPFLPLLHAICAAASMHSPLVSIAPGPGSHQHPMEDTFPEKLRMQQGRGHMFDETHSSLAEYGCYAVIRSGSNILEALQGEPFVNRYLFIQLDESISSLHRHCLVGILVSAVIMNSGQVVPDRFIPSAARWLEVWSSTSLAIKLCTMLGLNLPDTLQNPLPNATREQLLGEPPLSHVDVELRRNIFWLSYCLERYHLSSGPWGKSANEF